MATTFKKVGGPKTYIKLSEKKAGDVLVEGKFVGTIPNKFNADKPNFEFKPSDGSANVVLNSAGKLSYLMDSFVQPGDEVQVIYKGKSTIDKGVMKGKEAHDFDVLVAEREEVMSPAPSEESSIDLSDLD